MDDANSSKVAITQERHEAARGAGDHRGPLPSTLLDALRAYVRYNQAAIEVSFRTALARGRRFGH